MRHMLRRSVATLAVALMTAACAAAARAAEPAVLAEIPDDASVAIVIPNVKATSTHLANLGTRLGLPVPPDPMGAALRNFRITKGFDQAGSAAMVILKSPEKKAEDADAPVQPPAVLIFPTTDARASLEAFNPGTADKDGITEISLPNSPVDAGYSATVGNFVVFAQDRDVLARFLVKKQGLNKVLGAETLKTFEGADFVVYTNVATISKSAIAEVEKRRDETLAMLDLNDVNAGNEFSAAMRRVQIVQVFGAVKNFLTDANVGLMTLKLSDAGVNVGMIGQFKDESTIGKMLLAQKNVKPATLVGLPTGAVAAAGTFAWDSKNLAELTTGVIGASLADPVVAKSPQIEELKKGVEIYGKTVSLIKSANFVFFEAQAGSKSGWLNGALVVDTTDGPGYLKLTEELLANPLARESGDPDIVATVKVTKDAVTYSGVKLTKVVKTFALREETAERPVSDQAKRTLETMGHLYGKDGQVVYLGVVGNKVIYFMGSEGKTINGVIDAVTKNSDALATDPKFKAMETQLAPNSLATFYFSVDKWFPMLEAAMNKALGIADDGAAPEPAEAGAVPSRPMVVSVGVTGTTMTVEAHIPVSAITDIIKWGTELQQKLGGRR